MGWTFGEKPWTFRAADLKRERLNADWAAVTGPLGSVIGHLRARASRARWAAAWFLILLFVTAAAGLVFYLGLPLWQTYADGRLATLNATLRTLEVEKARLDQQRETLRGEIAETLALTFDPVPTGNYEQLDGHVQQGDALLLYGDRGTVLRARPDLSGFDRVPTGTDQALYGHVQQSGVLLLYGDGSTVLRAKPDLSGFDEVPTGTDAELYGHVQQGDALLLYGRDGTVLRARPDLSGFDEVPTETEAWLTGHVQQGDALLLYGDNGTVLRALPDLSGFDRVPTETDSWLEGHEQRGDTLLFFGSDGTVLRARPGLSSFDGVQAELNARLRDHVQQGDALLLYDQFGTVLRARPDLSGFDEVPTGTDAELYGHVQQGDALLLYGEGGTVLRAQSDLSGFDPVSTGIDAALLGHVQKGDALLIYGQGTVLRALPDLSGFDPVPTGTDQTLYRHVQQGSMLLLYGNGAIVLMPTNRWSTSVTGLVLAAGTEGDAALVAFMDQILPQYLREWFEASGQRDALTTIINQRAALDILRDRTNAEIDRYETSPLAYLRDDKSLEFKTFLNVCRGNNIAHEVTSACLTAWQTDQTGGLTWWRGVLDQVPPGILLLFLLATSAALYRYNLRLAGFHDSRADVLTLLVQTREPSELGKLLAATPTDVGNLTALVMAADKVEMGAIKAKLGAAEVEVARLLTSDGKGDG